VNLQIMQETLQSRARSGGEFLAGIVDSEKNAAILPAREGESSKTQPHFARLRCTMQSHGRRRQCVDVIKRGPRLIEERLRFAMRDKPGIQVARAPRIELFDGVQRRIMLLQLHCEFRIECGQPVCDCATSVLGKNYAKAGNRSPAARLARMSQPE
jgi:hypothetical protein